MIKPHEITEMFDNSVRMYKSLGLNPTSECDLEFSLFKIQRFHNDDVYFYGSDVIPTLTVQPTWVTVRNVFRRCQKLQLKGTPIDGSVMNDSILSCMVNITSCPFVKVIENNALSEFYMPTDVLYLLNLICDTEKNEKFVRDYLEMWVDACVMFIKQLYSHEGESRRAFCDWLRDSRDGARNAWTITSTDTDSIDITNAESYICRKMGFDSDSEDAHYEFMRTIGKLESLLREKTGSPDMKYFELE